MIKVRIHAFDYESSVGFWIYRRREEGGIDVLCQSKEVEHLVWHKYTQEEVSDLSFNLPATFKLRGDEKNEIKKALADALGKSGFISESHEGARGKLEATEKHLEDMRALVFKKGE